MVFSPSWRTLILRHSVIASLQFRTIYCGLSPIFGPLWFGMCLTTHLTWFVSYFSALWFGVMLMHFLTLVRHLSLILARWDLASCAYVLEHLYGGLSPILAHCDFASCKCVFKHIYCSLSPILAHCDLASCACIWEHFIAVCLLFSNLAHCVLASCACILEHFVAACLQFWHTVIWRHAHAF